MSRKTLATCAALVAFGVLAIAPAMSSAARLVDGTNTTVITNDAQIVGYNGVGQPPVVNSAGLKVECEHVTVTATVHNTGVVGGSVTGTITHATFAGTEPQTDCKSSLGAARIKIPALTNEGGTTHYCLEQKANTDEFLVTPNGCTLSPTNHVFTFILEVTGGFKCYFTRSEALSGTFTTGDASPVTLSVNKAKFNTETGPSHSIFCPASIDLENFKFQMYTDTDVTNGTWRHAASVADPVFIVNP